MVGGVSVVRMFEHQREYFLREIHTFIEKRLSETLGVEFSLGNLYLRTLQEAVLEDVSFQIPQEKASLFIQRVHLKRHKKGITLILKGGEAVWKEYALQNVTGKIEFVQSLDGSSFSLKEGAFTGEGKNQNSIEFRINKRNPLAYQAKINVQNFHWVQKRFSGEGTFLLLAKEQHHPWRHLKVKMEWNPVTLGEEIDLSDVHGHFTIHENYLFSEEVHWGELLSYTGETKLSYPFRTEGKLRIPHFDRETLSLFLENTSLSPEWFGGRFTLSGSLPRIRIHGHLVAHEGEIEDVDYKQVMNVFHGNWPVITVDSRIERKFPEDSYINIRGLLDMNQFGQKDFYKLEEIEGIEGPLVWKGISLENPSEETVIFGKENYTTEVRLKTYLNQNLPAEEESEELDLKYRILNDKNLRMRLRGTEEFWGLEHQINF